MTDPETGPGAVHPRSSPLPHDVALVAFDGSPTSVAALDWAAERSARLAPETSTLALVLVERPDAPAHLRARLDVRRADLLTAAEAKRILLPGTPVLTRVVEGSVDEAIVGIASAAELVVVGSGLQPHLIRRTLAERLWADGVRRVVVVPPLVPDGGVVVIVTDDGVGDDTLRFGLEEAALRGLALDLVCAGEEVGRTRESDERVAGLLSDAATRARSIAPGQAVTTGVHWGEPVETLRELSARSCLVVLEADPAAPHRGERIRRGLLLSVLAPTALIAPTGLIAPSSRKAGAAD